MTTSTDLRDSLAKLSETPVAPAQTPTVRPQFNRAPATNRRDPRPNQFPGYCRVCNVWVESNAGLLDGKVDGKWAVRHLPDECPSSTPEAAPAPLAAPTG